MIRSACNEAACSLLLIGFCSASIGSDTSWPARLPLADQILVESRRGTSNVQMQADML